MPDERRVAAGCGTAVLMPHIPAAEPLLQDVLLISDDAGDGQQCTFTDGHLLLAGNDFGAGHRCLHPNFCRKTKEAPGREDQAEGNNYMVWKCVRTVAFSPAPVAT
jgi:hypothetical protein